MTLTRKEWRKLIQDPRSKKQHGGVTLVTPEVGDRVRIIIGNNTGEEYEVVDVAGFVYRTALKVYINHESGIPTWYWPWEVEILK